MSERESTACAECHRAVYVEHVDDQGRCVFCRPAGVREPKKAPRTHADEDTTSEGTKA